MTSRQAAKTFGIVALVVGVTAVLGVLVVRDQMSRRQRDLFSSHPLKRLAALGFLSGSGASVENARLLRDYVAWERRPMLRRRAAQILARMEERLAGTPVIPIGDAASRR